MKCLVPRHHKCSKILMTTPNEKDWFSIKLQKEPQIFFVTKQEKYLMTSGESI